MHQTKNAGLVWFGDEGDGGGLEGTNNGLELVLREGPKVAPFTEFILNDVLQNACLLIDGWTVIWGARGEEAGHADDEARPK